MGQFDELLKRQAQYKQSATVADDWLPDSRYEPISVPETPAAELESPGVTAGDYGRTVMAGGASVVQGLGWLVKTLGADDTGQAIQDVGKNGVEYWLSGLSDAAKQEMAKEFVKDTPEGYEWGDASWNTVGLTAANSLLGTMLGMGVGGAAAKGFQLVPKLGPKLAGALGYGASEATIVAGQSGANVEAAIDQMPIEELAKHPEFQATYASLTDIQDEGQRAEAAKKIVRDAAAGEASALNALTTFVLSAPMGATIGKYTAGLPLATTRTRAIATGAAGEAGQEFLQSGAERLGQNYVIQQNADQSQSLSKGVLNEAIGGAAAGAVMGAPFGLAAPIEQPTSPQPGADQGETEQRPEEAPRYSIADMGVNLAQTVPVRQEPGIGFDMPLEQAVRQAQESEAARGGDSLSQATAGAKALFQAKAQEIAAQRAQRAAAEEEFRARQYDQQTQEMLLAQPRPSTALPDPEYKPRSLGELREMVRRNRESKVVGLLPAPESPIIYIPKPEGEPDTTYPTRLAAARANRQFLTEDRMEPVQVAARQWVLRPRALPEQTASPELAAQQTAALPSSQQTETVATPEAQAPTTEEIDTAANESAASPANNLPEPTEAQMEAGNYKVGRVNLHGLDIAVEIPKGGKRKGTASDGTKWEREAKSHYGRISRTVGADGEQVDVFIGDKPDSQQVFVVDQVNQDGTFDEHKVIMAQPNQLAAKRAYMANYPQGWKGLGAITPMSVDQFKTWLKEGDLKKPVGTIPAPSNEVEKPEDPAKTKLAERREQAKQKAQAAQAEPKKTLAQRRAERKAELAAKQPEQESEQKPADGTDNDDGVVYFKKDAKSQGATPRGLDEKEVDSVTKSFLKEFKGAAGVKVRVSRTQHEVFGARSLKDASGRSQRIIGGYDHKTDTLYLVASNLESVQELRATLQHELLVHKGLGILPQEEIDAFLSSVQESAQIEPSLQEAWESIQRDYHDQSPAIQAEELLAYIAESRMNFASRAWTRIQAAFRRLLRALGFAPDTMSKAEIMSKIYDIGDALASGTRPEQRRLPEDVMYRRRSSNRLVDRFTDLDQQQRTALGKIAPPTPKEKAVDWLRTHADRGMTKIRQGLVDRFAALKDLDEAVHGADVLEESITASSWARARLASGTGPLSVLLNHGRLKFDPNEKIIDTRNTDGGLINTLSKLGSAAEIERFMGWIAGNRADKLFAEGRENLFTREDIDALKTLNNGRTESGAPRRILYERVFKEFQQFRDDVLEIAMESGIITEEQRDAWANEFYVPFYRLMEEEEGFTGPKASGGISRQEAYKKLKGGRQNLNDLLQNTILNFHHLLDASLKNLAAQQAIDNAMDLQIAEEVRESARDPKNSTFVLRDGQKKFYQIEDPLVFKALTALAHPGMNSTFMKIMRGFKRVFTNMTTTTPQFVVANLLRDSMQAAATSPVSKNFLKNMVRGGESYKDAAFKARMMATGGSFSFGHIYGSNADELKLQLANNLERAELISKPSMIPAAIKAVWRRWSDFTDFTENVNRAAIFEQNQQKGKMYAAFQARDLMDFSSHGAWPAVRVLIDIVPFLNARLQGLDKIYRSGVKPGVLTAFKKGSESDALAAKRFWVVTGALALATIALYLGNHDDDEYRKLEEWQKDTYWFLRVGDTAIFIPKPFEVGAIATMVERLTEQLVDEKAKGKLFAQRLGHMLTDTFSFSPVPQMFAPAFDVYANKDSFTGREIESQSMQRLSPSMRTRTDTTMVAQWLSSATEGLFGPSGKMTLSPVQIDHMIQGYLGAVGAWVAGSADTIVKGAMGDEAPAKYWYEYQPLRRFYRNLGDEQAYTRYNTIFYDALKDVNRVYADIREYQKYGQMEAARDLMQENRQKLAMRQWLTKVNKQLSEINSRMKVIQRSDQDGEWKRREIDRLNVMKNRLTEMAGKKLETADL